ncbi:hypothetical protein K438DRAFT_1784350 [Mycena galopus ATCC 62051]|nr:hypothetical protein K438DRAFT_1784350 [Mycena galopus ATCC 62051]
MSSRATTPSNDDDMRAIMAAMDQESPTASAPNASKRTRSTLDGTDDSDDERGVSGSTALVLTNQNITAATKLYGDKKRLRGDQITELEVFVNDPPSLREAKMFANLFVIGNELGKLVKAQAGYQPSPELIINITKYAPAVLLSSKITCYKGDAATYILLALTKKFRFDIPPGLENIPADWAKVTGVAQYALTQRRGKIKKQLRASLNPDEKGVYGPDAEHQNIYDLAQVIVKDTQCAVNVVLCARIALMRQVYLVCPGKKTWDKLDEHLAEIRANAKGDAKKITRAFRHVLTQDQDKHGAKNYVLDENPIDDFQQQVDDLIDVNAIDAATST